MDPSVDDITPSFAQQFVVWFETWTGETGFEDELVACRADYDSIGFHWAHLEDGFIDDSDTKGFENGVLIGGKFESVREERDGLCPLSEQLRNMEREAGILSADNSEVRPVHLKAVAIRTVEDSRSP